MRTDEAGVVLSRVGYARAFDACAPLYARVRPGYPASLMDDLAAQCASAKGCRAVEVGAGTGQATIPLAERGFELDCIEPSRRMSASLRARCTRFTNVRIHTTTFEKWQAENTYDALIAAQSWHLTDPRTRLARAADIIRTGGMIALFWNQLPLPADESYRKVMNSVLNRFHLNSPELPTQQGFSKPVEFLHTRRCCFTPSAPQFYTTELVMTLPRYLDLLRTYPEYASLRQQDWWRLRKGMAGIFGDSEISGYYITVLHSGHRKACKKHQAN